MITAAVPAGSFSWDRVEPHCEQNEVPMACYSRTLKADLLPGTFVLLAPRNTSIETRSQDACMTVARIVGAETSLPSSRTSVQVNIFKRLNDFSATEGFLHPRLLDENHLRHLAEIVQTQEIRTISSDEIMNLAFVFTMASLQDTSNLFYTCQGMTFAFVVRYRSHLGNDQPILIKLPDNCCLPFPSSYQNSRYHDCFPSRMWNSVICVKLEMTRLLGRYSHQQGLYGKEVCRLSNFTAEAWGFLRLQFDNIFDAAGCGVSSRTRRHRVIESGLVVKAAQVSKRCTILRFETKAHLQHLCYVFGESTTAGQRCRLPKISAPKSLWQNDIINVVCGSDDHEPGFNSKTVRDGIDLEFDGCNELFITIRYRRFTYSSRRGLVATEECDPLLSSLIHRCNPYPCDPEDVVQEDHHQGIIMNGSEFEDHDGCLYRVVSIHATYVCAKCCYPQHNNALFGREKQFDIQLAKVLIEFRLR
ncbi:hypothetical protein MHU86_8975 [Fragilaria crotonensis]|nr:hypothetical protein MHU86_21080 [Fragilaria crotonensis]KAI2505452.1 hypothetical protein MHU86_8975 [Fragilaria crotonensis]